MFRASVAALAATLGALSSLGTRVPEALAARVPALGAVLADATAARRGAFSEGIPMRAPTAVGMSAERLAAVDRVVLRGIGAGGYPGASVVVGRKGYAVLKRGYGTLSWGASAAAVSDQTIYDLASLTKVVGTTSAIMVLYDEGKLDLDAPVKDYLPAFAGGMKDRVTLRHLLTHRSGLPAGRDLWRSASSPAEARRQVLETPLYCRPGDCFEYSDLGADVLGFVAETVSGQRLDVLLEERVFGPLGMNDTHFRPPTWLRERIAPTEVTPPRGYPLRGEVHDENAFALGGIAGHAGLFSTANDLSIFAQTLLNGGAYGGVRVFADSTVKLFTARAAGTRALGWDTCNQKGSCGSLMDAGAYGHTGFTGTSLWLDPARDMFVLLLTNRVHAARALRPSKVIADVRADLADAAELAVLDDPMGPRAMPVAFRADEASGWNRPAASARASSKVAKAAKGKRGKVAAAKKASGSKARAAKGGKSAKSSVARARTAKGAKATASAKAKSAKGSARAAKSKVATKSSTKASTKAKGAKRVAAR